MKSLLLSSAIFSLFVVAGCSSNVEPLDEANPAEIELESADNAAVDEQSAEGDDSAESESGVKRQWSTLPEWKKKGGKWRGAATVRKAMEKCWTYARSRKCCSKSFGAQAQCVVGANTDNKYGQMCRDYACHL
jgi:hypothetical protein